MNNFLTMYITVIQFKKQNKEPSADNLLRSVLGSLPVNVTLNYHMLNFFDAEEWWSRSYHRIFLNF